MYKKLAHELAEEKLKEVIASDRDRIMNLLDPYKKERERVIVSKEGEDYLRIIKTTWEEGGEEKHVLRRKDDEAFRSLDLPDEITHYLCVGAFYDDEETKKLLRVWVDVSDGTEEYAQIPLCRSEVLNADDLSLYRQKL